MEFKIIKLTQGQETIVDQDIYQEISHLKWQASRSKNGFYATRGGKQVNKKRQPTLPLHRYIMNPKNNEMVDHINGNTLDNRRKNLRICNNTQNQRNQKLATRNTSGYKGVSWHKLQKQWIARIRLYDKLIHLGYFVDVKRAAEAYDRAAKHYYGEFARTNKCGI